MEVIIKTGENIMNKIRCEKGYTLIEMMIVIAIIGILSTMSLPSMQRSLIRAKEATLRNTLFTFRNIIDQYYADNGVYPESLENLVDKQYIRTVPKDPFTGTFNTWILLPPPVNVEDTEDENEEPAFQLYDVHSGSNLVGLNNIPYNEW